MRLKELIWKLIETFGRRIRDERTCQFLGRALVCTWQGRPWLAGLHRPYVRPIFLPETRVKYARHRMGFCTYAPVDYPRLLPNISISSTNEILWAILFHQAPEHCENILNHWERLGFPRENILVVHGGQEEDFQKLSHSNKVFVADANLRTRQHPVEKQSYTGAMREVSRWLSTRMSFEYVCLLEYDHLPLLPDWGTRLIDLAQRESADVLMHHLTRVDGTNAPHYLYHLSDPAFASAWQSSSLREDRNVVLNCMATGSFWKREAWDSVAATPEPTPIYLEMYLPSQAHHLGFRVRDHGDQNEFVHFDSLPTSQIKKALSETAWSIHPVKNLSKLTEAIEA